MNGTPIQDQARAFLVNLPLCAASWGLALWGGGPDAAGDARQLAFLAGAFFGAVFTLAAAAALLGLVFAALGAGVSAAVASGASVGSAHAAGAWKFYGVRSYVAGVAGVAVALAGTLLAFLIDGPSLWAVVPLTLGAGVARLPRLTAWVRSRSWYLRLYGGDAPRAEFAQGLHLEAAASPFADTFVPGAGYCADALFLGTSHPESA